MNANTTDRPIPAVGLLLAPTHRSRAYVQALAHLGLRPERCFALPGAEAPALGRRPAPFELFGTEEPFHFNPDAPAVETARSLGWEVTNLPASDVNHPDVCAAFKEAGLPVMIYSGMPKALLKQPVLDLPVRFLHIHGGYLPRYRGATGFYFGMLEEGRLGNTAIWIDEGVDTGPILDRRWYEADFDSDVDLVADPVTRADLLVRVLTVYVETGIFPSAPRESAYEHFYVIHPVLKHLALRRTRRETPAARGRGTRV